MQSTVKIGSSSWYKLQEEVLLGKPYNEVPLRDTPDWQTRLLFLAQNFPFCTGTEPVPQIPAGSGPIRKFTANFVQEREASGKQKIAAVALTAGTVAGPVVIGVVIGGMIFPVFAGLGGAIGFLAGMPLWWPCKGEGMRIAFHLPQVPSNRWAFISIFGEEGFKNLPVVQGAAIADLTEASITHRIMKGILPLKSDAKEGTLASRATPFFAIKLQTKSGEAVPTLIIYEAPSAPKSWIETSIGSVASLKEDFGMAAPPGYGNGIVRPAKGGLEELGMLLAGTHKKLAIPTT